MMPVSPVRSITSEPALLPAEHSPAAGPETTLLFAELIASDKLHRPSFGWITSEVVLTTIVVASGLMPPLSANTVDDVESLLNARREAPPAWERLVQTN